MRIRTIPPPPRFGGTPSCPAGAAGPLQFARYAAPPNRLGYCGPPEHHALWAHAHGGVVDRELLAVLGEFDGVLMHLRAITCLAGGRSVLDARVVEAYWIGNRLLDRIEPTACARWLDAGLRERGQPGLLARGVTEALPHHNFHVLRLYPWVDLLDGPSATNALRVLDGCRIRWGRVMQVRETAATVRSRPLEHDGRLRLGAPADEEVSLTGGFGAPATLVHGDWVALHWDRVVDRLTVDQVRDLARFTAVALRPGPGHSGR